MQKAVDLIEAGPLPVVIRMRASWSTRRGRRKSSCRSATISVRPISARAGSRREPYFFPAQKRTLCGRTGGLCGGLGSHAFPAPRRALWRGFPRRPSRGRALQSADICRGEGRAASGGIRRPSSGSLARSATGRFSIDASSSPRSSAPFAVSISAGEHGAFGKARARYVDCIGEEAGGAGRARYDCRARWEARGRDRARRGSADGNVSGAPVFLNA